MASKRARKKNKSIKIQKRVEREKQERKSKVMTYTSFFFVALFAGFLIYLWISSINAPLHVPSSDVGASTGPEDAEVVFLEFGCFTCPFTEQFNLNVMPTLLEEYGDRVRFVFRSSPIYSNPGAELAGVASKCAGKQDFFWEFSEDLFRQRSYNKDNIISLASNYDIDIDEFSRCLDDDSMASLVREDYREARKARITVTPTLFINDVRINGAVDINSLRQLLDDKLEKYSS